MWSDIMMKCKGKALWSFMGKEKPKLGLVAGERMQFGKLYFHFKVVAS